MAGITRRQFVETAAGGGAFLAVAPAGKQIGKLVSRIKPDVPERPGYPVLYATTCRECPAGCGMHAWHRDGRVVKVEGNPAHPVNRGGLCARGQSSLQGLYDPDRVTTVRRRSEGTWLPTIWEVAFAEIGARLARATRVVLLSSLQTGALAEVFAAFCSRFDRGTCLFLEPAGTEAVRQAHDELFGLPLIPDYRLESCDCVLSFAADFLETWVSPVRFARQFADAHTPHQGRQAHLIYLGPHRSLTAGNADTCHLLTPWQMRATGLAILHELLDRGWGRRDADPIRKMLAAAGDTAAIRRGSGLPEAAIRDIARRFGEAPASVALAGPLAGRGPIATDIAKIAALLNHATERHGPFVDFARAHAWAEASDRERIASTLRTLGRNDVLIVHDCNPAYAIPEVAENLSQAGLVVCLDTLMTESAERAHWVLPIDSPLEAWGDYEPMKGLHSRLQPTLSRLHDTRHPGDILLQLAAHAGRPLARARATPPSFKDWLDVRWRDLAPGADSLRAGFHDVAPPAVSVVLKPDARLSALKPPDSAGQQLWSYPSIFLFDGRLANRGWLQEAPDPISTITWGSWADVHSKTAQALGLAADQEVRLSAGLTVSVLPVRISEDVAEGFFAVPMGQGHTALGGAARNRGVNPFALLAGGQDGAWVEIRAAAIDRVARPVYASASQRQFGRGILQWIEAPRLSAMRPGDGDALILPLPEGYDPKRDLYPKRAYAEHRWAMVIDLQRCIGCGACAVACYAENNVPVMGAQQVALGREMAWLKVVPYRHEQSAQRVGWLPMLCQQCDAAPCEPVCPVFASVHNEEGLNAQVYNRCIGTRYCSNNCPYKVRRFNWFNTRWPPALQLQLNPEVTTRCRGVMEKCTFCIQRIRAAEHTAAREQRPVADGEIQPACAQSCPARAIVFGDLLNPRAQVTVLTRTDPRRYHVLEELNVKPAVTYLRRVVDGPVETA